MNKICLFYTSNLSNKIIYYNFIKKISFSKFDSVFNLWLKMRILGTKCIQKNKEKFLKNKNFHRKKSKKKQLLEVFQNLKI